jgi:hypothetical protein
LKARRDGGAAEEKSARRVPAGDGVAGALDVTLVTQICEESW